MADKTELRARLEFRKKALEKLRAAYLALVDGRVKSYTIDDRELTRLDIGDLRKEIEAAEREVDQFEAALAGSRGRRAFGILPRDW